MVAVNGRIFYESNQPNNIDFDNMKSLKDQSPPGLNEQSFLNLSTYSDAQNGLEIKPIGNVYTYKNKIFMPAGCSPSKPFVSPDIPKSYNSTRSNIQNLNQASVLSQAQSNASIMEFKVNSAYLVNGREICGYMDDELGEYQSIQ